MSVLRALLHGRAHRVAGALTLAWLCGLSSVAAQSGADDIDHPFDRRVKAAFVYQFVPYVEWPPQAFAAKDTSIVVAVVGSDATVADMAEVIATRLAQDRPVVVRRWRESDLAGGVHVAYVRRSESHRLATIARAAQATSTLVISEVDDGLAQGSMINFDLVEGRVRFDIALATLENAGLRVSARLLAVARNVKVQP